MFIAMNLSNYY